MTPSEPRASAGASSPRTRGTSGSVGGAGAVGVVVLAGGTGRRLGGVSKPDVVARGERLLDHVLAGIESLRAPLGLGGVVVVAPEEVALPVGVLRALEDPPLGGPVAGLAAGLLALAHVSDGAEAADGPVPLTAVLTCDAPDSYRALPALLVAAQDAPERDGAVAVSGRGADRHTQYLLGVYRTARLSAVVAPGGRPLRDVAVHRTLRALDVVELAEDAVRDASRDLDTWQDVHDWERAGGGPSGDATVR